MKNILLIGNAYPSKTNPGYGAFIPNIQDCLSLSGYQVDLLVMSSDYTTFIGKYIQYIRYYLNILFFPRYKEYSYVYINMYPYSFIPLIPHFSKMQNVVIHWHGCDVFPETSFASTLNRLSYRFIKDSFIHIAPSQYFAKEAAKKINLDIQKFFVSPSGGVDMRIFKEKSTGNRSTELIRLGFASVLFQTKGIDLVVQLLNSISQIEKELACRIEFHFIEYGKEKEKYVEILSHFPNVVKHSPYPLSRMTEFYHQVDVLLFPSLSESLGLVALEAMACNIPVIATDGFAFKETVINSVSGERFTMNDFSSFQSALIRCLKNIDSYRPQEFVLKNYSRQSVIENYKMFFN